MSYKVPMDIPKYCNKCPFAQCNFSIPGWAKENHNVYISSVDGKENKPDSQGFVCILEKHQKGKFETVVRSDRYEGNIPKPDWCPLEECEV